MEQPILLIWFVVILKHYFQYFRSSGTRVSWKSYSFTYFVARLYLRSTTNGAFWGAYVSTFFCCLVLNIWMWFFCSLYLSLFDGLLLVHILHLLYELHTWIAWDLIFYRSRFYYFEFSLELIYLWFLISIWYISEYFIVVIFLCFCFCFCNCYMHTWYNCLVFSFICMLVIFS